MRTVFLTLVLLCSLGGMGILIYTLIHEDKDNDLLFDYHKSFFMRDLAIVLYNLACAFSMLALLVS